MFKVERKPSQGQSSVRQNGRTVLAMTQNNLSCSCKSIKYKGNLATDEFRVDNQNHVLAWSQSGNN